MKKLFILVAATIFFASCHDSSGTNGVKDSTNPITPAPDNVNGNVPETTRTNMNQPQAIDSSKLKDSMKKH